MNRRPLVLLVEDDVSLLEASSAVLRRYFGVLTAANYREGTTKLLYQKDLAAVITDYNLPDGSGALIRRLALLQGIPVLMVSGDPGVGYVYRPFLAKPYPVERLVEFVLALGPHNSVAQDA
jgi:DNA-binding response OmpR family regulator